MNKNQELVPGCLATYTVDMADEPLPIAHDTFVAHWSLTLQASRTPRAHAQIFDVLRKDGTPAILKVYRDDTLGYETHAPAFLDHMTGCGTVRLYGRHGAAVLQEKQGGPPLARMAVDGQDAEATDILIGIAQHMTRRPAPPGIAEDRDVRVRYQALLADDLPDTPETRTDIFHAARALADTLMRQSEGQPRCLLHGDLHHDNILLGARGWLAIDPIVFRGSPEAEFAQVFRNPRGLGDNLTDPTLAIRRATQIASATGFEAKTLLAWGAAKCAHSLVLNHANREKRAQEHRILTALMTAWRSLDTLPASPAPPR
ncbi:MAG: aminoglycoside phosphotransferase family protein [Pseudomonadota bacterium]